MTHHFSPRALDRTAVDETSDDRFVQRHMLARAQVVMDESALKTTTEQLKAVGKASRLAARYDEDEKRFAHHMRVAARIAFVLESRGE